MSFRWAWRSVQKNIYWSRSALNKRIDALKPPIPYFEQVLIPRFSCRYLTVIKNQPRSRIVTNSMPSFKCFVFKESFSLDRSLSLLFILFGLAVVVNSPLVLADILILHFLLLVELPIKDFQHIRWPDNIERVTLRSFRTFGKFDLLLLVVQLDSGNVLDDVRKLDFLLLLAQVLDAFQLQDALRRLRNSEPISDLEIFGIRTLWIGAPTLWQRRKKWDCSWSRSVDVIDKLTDLDVVQKLIIFLILRNILWLALHRVLSNLPIVVELRKVVDSWFEKPDGRRDWEVWFDERWRSLKKGSSPNLPIIDIWGWHQHWHWRRWKMSVDLRRSESRYLRSTDGLFSFPDITCLRVFFPGDIAMK